jgi:Histidine kinase-like ATPase domain
VGPTVRVPPPVKRDTMSMTSESSPRVRRLTLPGARGAVTRSRMFTADALLDWRWLPGADRCRQDAAQDVLLLVSELVTNACLHTSGPTELTLSRTPDRLRIEVGDRGRALPVPQPGRRPGRPGGHGMLIVDRLSARWGVERREHGKAVWVEVAAPVASGPDA